MQNNLGALIDALCICNNKLFEVCSKKANCDSMSESELRELCRKDIALCKERAMLKNEINKLFHGSAANEEVKNY